MSFPPTQRAERIEITGAVLFPNSLAIEAAPVPHRKDKAMSFPNTSYQDTVLQVIRDTMKGNPIPYPGFKRNSCIWLRAPAERAIGAAITEIEALWCDSRLSRAQMLLNEAMTLVGEVIDDKLEEAKMPKYEFATDKNAKPPEPEGRSMADLLGLGGASPHPFAGGPNEKRAQSMTNLMNFDFGPMVLDRTYILPAGDVQRVEPGKIYLEDKPESPHNLAPGESYGPDGEPVLRPGTMIVCEANNHRCGTTMAPMHRNAGFEYSLRSIQFKPGIVKGQFTCPSCGSEFARRLSSMYGSRLALRIAVPLMERPVAEYVWWPPQR